MRWKDPVPFLAVMQYIMDNLQEYWEKELLNIGGNS